MSLSLMPPGSLPARPQLGQSDPPPVARDRPKDVTNPSQQERLWTGPRGCLNGAVFSTSAGVMARLCQRVSAHCRGLLNGPLNSVGDCCFTDVSRHVAQPQFSAFSNDSLYLVDQRVLRRLHLLPRLWNVEELGPVDLGELCLFPDPGGHSIEQMLLTSGISFSRSRWNTQA